MVSISTGPMILIKVPETSTSPKTALNRDFCLVVSAAAITVFIYVWVVPLVLWTVLWWLKMNGSMKLAGALCVYGYSMFLYIPVSVGD